MESRAHWEESRERPQYDVLLTPFMTVLLTQQPVFWLLGSPCLSSSLGHYSLIATPTSVPVWSGPGKWVALTWDSLKHNELLPPTAGVRMLGMLFKVQQAISHSPSISSHLSKKLSTPPTNILHLVGAGAELSIFPAQKDHSPVLWNIENPPPMSSANPNLPCSPAPPTHRQFLSLFGRQAPTGVRW